jgi:hypothetical protein
MTTGPEKQVEGRLHAEILDTLTDGEDWRGKPDDEGNAAVALAATVLQDGRADLPHVRKVTGFYTDTLRTARQRISHRLVGTYTDCKLAAAQDEVDDGLWWTLLAAVGAGFLEETTDAS